MSRRIGLIAVGLLLISQVSWAWVTPVLIMYAPPQGQTTAYAGYTSGIGDNRWFYRAFVVKTNPLTDDLSVTVHMGGATKSAPQSGTGTYTTANWDITTLHSPKTVYATSPDATQSGNATVHFKKNRQVAVWVHDYKGCEYEWSKKGPCSTHFDCSGLQGYMYNQVGYDYDRFNENAQTQYNESTHISQEGLLPGDMIFFDTNNDPPDDTKINHTGVYVGEDQMVHAFGSPVNEVVQTDLEDTYKGQTWYYWAFYGHRYGANERF